MQEEHMEHTTQDYRHLQHSIKYRVHDERDWEKRKVNISNAIIRITKRQYNKRVGLTMSNLPLILNCMFFRKWNPILIPYSMFFVSKVTSKCILLLKATRRKCHTLLTLVLCIITTLADSGRQESNSETLKENHLKSELQHTVMKGP